MFGQLANALRAGGHAWPELARLDGVRRRQWTKNTLRLRALEAAREPLRQSGIATMPAGGLALLLRQPHAGDRPLVDADFSLDGAELERAVAILTGEGWSEILRRRDGYLMDLHAVTLERDKQQITLRAVPGRWPYGPDTDSNTDGLPSAARLLAYTLVEGFRLWGYTPTRRYADVLLLLRDPAGLDWRDFLQVVRARHGEAVVLAALVEVECRVAGLVPADVLEQLTESVGRRERVAASADLRLGTAAVILRRTAGLSGRAVVAATPGILCDLWDVARPSELPSAGLRRMRLRFLQSSSASSTAGARP
ncbi:nucleotidyltransferase family protein [Intrasporangium chromatireducens]|uniref:nucleotidyltransferase family protein n=1 Tax=Intrasporangium chromatireducens TaxID=1386088 RepID=UPI00138DE68B|nr:nucleotidyltransferase family protein [Intrasporangium chromatireducens]